ncbi:hypothetical protein G6011_00713 [Alternaria panax]|uniref:WD40 repeat-like protein n=1 Tax=Alternaria panax TaxID=48097 RepID=A0AAD4NUZ8_9PLEO|nr:hypothetical protein G6011_00713 [Alternaria panax]
MSNWRNGSDWRHSIVDLTTDDDAQGSDEGPLSSLPLGTHDASMRRHARAHGHGHAHVPLPPPASSHPPIPTTRPTHAHHPRLPGSASTATDAANMGRDGAAPNTYMPLPGHGHAHNAGHPERPAKRIKMSAGAPKPATKREIPSAAQTANPSVFGPCAHISASSAANKPPSVQDINRALKKNTGPATLLHNVEASSPRALHIGRQSTGTSASPVMTAPHQQRETSQRTQTPAGQREQPRHVAVHRGKRQTSAERSRRGPGRPRIRPPPAGSSIPPSRPNYFAGPAEEPSDEDKDSVMSDASSPPAPVSQQTSDAKAHTGYGTPGLGPAMAAFHSSTLSRGSELLPPPPPPPPSTGRKRQMTPFDTEQDQYLIFLKEVKQFSWAKITAEYNVDMPARQYSALQSRYSTFLNKRDRSNDPSKLILPPRWAAEATVDWNQIHGASTSSRGPSNSQFTAPRQPRHQEQVVPKHIPIQQTIERDYSSGGDSAPRRQRSRRAQRVNYTWPRQRGVAGDEVEEYAEVFGAVRDESALVRSETPQECDAPLPSQAVAVDNEPLQVEFNADDAALGLSLCTIQQSHGTHVKHVPYLSSGQRLAMQSPSVGSEWDQLSSRDWQGSLLHVDFSPAEIKSVEKTVAPMKSTRSRHSTKARRLRQLLKGCTDTQALQIVESLRSRLPCRDRSSIEAFIQDAMAGNIANVPQIQRLAAARPNTEMQSIQNMSTTSIIRQRELGCQSRRGWQAASKPLTYQVSNKYMHTMGPAASWTGASGDIHTVAWAPDGEHFAAGAVAVDDPDSMQYNRPNNLLFGSTMHGTIHELAEHYRIRERTESGANSSHAMFASQDPKLYTTVTAVAFSNSSHVMYSSGYDGHIGIWDTNTESVQPILSAKLNVKDKIDILSVNQMESGIIATAAKALNDKTIRVLRINEDEPWQFEKSSFHSNKAVDRIDLKILPTALQFEPICGKQLLAGFGANRKETGFDMTGDLCLWDVETKAPYYIHGSNRNVFDVAFNPIRSSMPLFAAGCVAVGSNVNRGTRSTVRLYDIRDDSRFTCPLQFECKALDMNDLAWCPHDEYLIAAGCTDGRAYVWDARWPDDPLRILSHSRSLMPLQEDVKHELADTGVRFLSWGQNATRLYSGSSDGVVKVWDVTRAEENTFIKDLITCDSGIMSAAFSADYSKLVVGEVNGSVNVLEVGRDDTTIKDVDRLRYMPYQDDEQDDIEDYETGDMVRLAPESGIAEGKYLLQTQQLQLASMGSLPTRQVVQGQNYVGPFDQSVDAPFLREQALQFQLGLTTPLGPQCNIPACRDNLNKVTSEDVGDSRRSADRIPDELRRQWMAIDAKSIILGKSKCTYCGRPARPSVDTSDVVLCERCSFACFRCGSVNPIAPSTTTLICDACAGVWDIGVLGYECIQQPQPHLHNNHMEPDVPTLEKWGGEAHEDREEDFDTTHGDEMNALTDYYMSLAIDRPESPPL